MEACPVCRYDVGGLDAAVCPECGATLRRVLVSDQSPRHSRVQGRWAMVAVLLLGVAVGYRRVDFHVHEIKRLAYEVGLQEEASNARLYAGLLLEWSKSVKPGFYVEKPRRPMRLSVGPSETWRELGPRAVWRHWPSYAVMAAGWLMVAGALGVDLAYRRSPMPVGVARHLGSVAVGGVGLMGVGVVG